MLLLVVLVSLKIHLYFLMHAELKPHRFREFAACRFEDILRALTMERSKVCEAMVFAIDNAESAGEVK